jgi:hypothetical protein
MTIELRAFKKWDRIFVLIAGAIGGAIAVANCGRTRQGAQYCRELAKSPVAAGLPGYVGNEPPFYLSR